jgi:hypothetical protein
MAMQQPDGGHKGIELLLVIAILAMFATIIATSLGLFAFATDQPNCVISHVAQSSSSVGLKPMNASDDSAATRQLLDSAGRTCAG